MLARIAERFGAQLHAPAAELVEIGQHGHIDVPLGSRHVDANGIEVIPTPGHSPGSTCYLVPGASGQTYLFTGDTLMAGDDGSWVAGYLPQFSEAAPLADSLRLLSTLRPDVVISSARPGASAVHVAGRRWADYVAQASSRLAAAVA